MKMITRIIPIAVLAASCSLATGHEALHDNVAMQSKTVKFSRSAAESPEGAQALYRRVRFAANDVCREASFAGPGVNREMQGCAAGAVDRAVQDINVPAVTAIHYRGNKVEGSSVEVIANR